MQIDDYMSNGLLRRWELSPLGQPRCRFDAVDPRRLSQTQRDAILVENARVRDLIGKAESVEQAQRIRAGEQPDETTTGQDGDGNAIVIPNPLYTEWAEAKKTISGASESIKSLLKLRAGEYPTDERGEPITPQADDSPDPMASVLAQPYEAVPRIISDRQFAQELAIREKITWPEAIAWASKGDLPAKLKTALAKLPTANNARASAEMLLSSATDYDREHPMAATLGGLLGYSDADLDDIWRKAALL